MSPDRFALVAGFGGSLADYTPVKNHHAMRTQSTTSTLLIGLLFIVTTNISAQAQPVNTATGTTASTMSMPPASVGQTVTINNTAFVVSTTKQLATGVEYYTMKAPTPKAKPSSFLRSNNKYNATVFTQAQYETFLKTGKLSSFGALRSTVINGTKANYTTNGTTTAVYARNRNGDRLTILEFVGSVDELSLQVGGGPSPDHQICIRGCSSSMDDCEAAYGVDDPECWGGWVDCVTFCDEIFTRTRPAKLHSLQSVMPILLK